MGFFDDARAAPSQARSEIESDIADRHDGVHNFTLGTLACYFRFYDLPDSHVAWDGQILRLSGLPGSSPRKTFVFAASSLPLPPASYLDALRQDGPLYSIQKLAAGGRSTFKETAYDLPCVFDAASYPSSKKRQQRLRQPPKLLERHGIKVALLTEDDRPEIEKLHNDWVAHKLAQPATMKIMFPKARYMNCALTAFKHPKDYMVFGAWKGDKLLGVRVVYVRGSMAFDMAFFTATWTAFSNFTECMALDTMRLMLARGITYLSCGAGLNKNLDAYKMHWPHRHVASYAYSRLKP